MDDTLRQIIAELVRAHTELDQLRAENEQLKRLIVPARPQPPETPHEAS